MVQKIMKCMKMSSLVNECYILVAWNMVKIKNNLMFDFLKIFSEVIIIKNCVTHERNLHLEWMWKKKTSWNIQEKNDNDIRGITVEVRNMKSERK